uniref:Polyprotein protein n=1 Tax=Solanum tuberosum TaxID=4113 RepID=M1DJZ4_SOLTU
MGHLAHSADVRATKLEAVVSWMIESAILDALTPLRASIYTLTMDGVAVDESEAETNEEQIEVLEETIYGDLPDLEETIVQSIHTSLTEMSMEGPSRVSSADVAPGTDVPTDGAIV